MGTFPYWQPTIFLLFLSLLLLLLLLLLLSPLTLALQVSLTPVTGLWQLDFSLVVNPLASCLITNFSVPVTGLEVVGQTGLAGQQPQASGILLLFMQRLFCIFGFYSFFQLQNQTSHLIFDMDSDQILYMLETLRSLTLKNYGLYLILAAISQLDHENWGIFRNSAKVQENAISPESTSRYFDLRIQDEYQDQWMAREVSGHKISIFYKQFLKDMLILPN